MSPTTEKAITLTTIGADLLNHPDKNPNNEISAKVREPAMKEASFLSSPAW